MINNSKVMKGKKSIFDNRGAYIYKIPHFLEKYRFAQRLISRTTYEGVLDTMLSSDYHPETDICIKNEYNSIIEIDSDNVVTDSILMADKIVLACNVQKPAWLIIADSYYPGWSAYSNGKKLELVRSNYLVKGIRVVDKGNQKIYCLYNPISHTIGLMITMISLVFLIIIAQIHIIKRYNISLNPL